MLYAFDGGGLTLERPTLRDCCRSSTTGAAYFDAQPGQPTNFSYFTFFH